MTRKVDRAAGHRPTRQEAQEAKNAAIAELAQAFTNPVRLQILGILNQTESSVDVLADKIGQTRANTSAQLKALSRSHLVTSRRSGRNVHYRLASDRVRELWSVLQAVAAETVPSLQHLMLTYFEPAGTFTRKDGEALLRAVERGETVLFDLRPEDEFRAGHLPAARSIPFQELDRRIAEVPKSKPAVAYCRGRYCVIAADSVERLRSSGRNVRNLNAGVSDWARAGLPIESGEV